MLRFLRRKLLLCVLLIVGFAALKQLLPEIGNAVGGWISGTGDSRVAAAFSQMYDALSEGHGMGKAVEVFFDGLQDTRPN